MREARVALTFVFLADGVMVGSWASRIPAVKDGLGLTTSQLGVALFAMSALRSDGVWKRFVGATKRTGRADCLPARAVPLGQVRSS